MRFLGLDLGTTTITALILDANTGVVEGVRTVPNRCEVTSALDGYRGRSEWDVERMVALAIEAVKEVVAAVGGGLMGIGVTGQMHGMLLVSADREAVGPFVGWQDQRGVEIVEGMEKTYVDRMAEIARKIGVQDRGCRAQTGYMGTTLFWMAQNDMLPSVPCSASFLPDYLVAVMTGTPPVTDATNATGTGVFDVVERFWVDELIGELGLSPNLFPEVRPSCSQAGSLIREVAIATGLPEGLPVFVACGDNQASFSGSVANYEKSLLINVGTGGQVSVHTEGVERLGELELRAYMDGAYLLVGAGLVGGRSYAWLKGIFQEIGQAFFHKNLGIDFYEKMNRLAAAVPPGCEGLRCEPLFTGTPLDPKRRGRWYGVGPTNFTPGHIARALLEGMSEQFWLLYKEMDGLGEGGRNCLIGSGNGIRNNPLLQEILVNRFGMKLAIPVHKEEAAFGAGLLASVGYGVFGNLKEAGQIIRYS